MSMSVTLETIEFKYSSNITSSQLTISHTRKKAISLQQHSYVRTYFVIVAKVK